uniref:Uncharacterized protein n=1 Tax=Molossus molossus TaxID=27622 RepID=A0A7J8DQ08_MOLMO|nr:hypothetical protein HJG59_009249 [Molossus molossus]
MLEMSKRHVSKMSMCMCDMFRVSGTHVPSQKRMSSTQKGKSVRMLRERLESGVLSLLERREKSILSVSGRREQVRREFSDSTPKGPARSGWKSPKMRPLKKLSPQQAFNECSLIYSVEREVTSDKLYLSLEALAPENSSSWVPSWFCPPPFVQSTANLSNCLNQMLVNKWVM